ncbi:hypothetical protein B7463_g8017, partial [Scytalidium lignicola]
MSKACAHAPHQPNSFTCTYTFPSKNRLSSTYFLDETDSTAQLTRWNSSSIAGGGNLGTEVNGQAILSGFEAIQVFPIAFGTPMPIHAWECSLSLCLKTYATVEITNSAANLSSSTKQPLFAFDTPNTVYGADQQWLNLTTRSKPTESSSNYTIRRADFYNTGNYLSTMFTAAWSDGGGVDSSQAGVPSVGPQLATSSNLSESMAILATSMAEAIRTGPNSTTISGNSYVQKTFIHVSWGWLALPLTLILSSGVMLFLVAYRTRKEGLPAWKNDHLAMLFSRMEGSEYQNISSRAGSKDLENIARDIHVQLSQDGRMLFIQTE